MFAENSFSGEKDAWLLEAVQRAIGENSGEWRLRPAADAEQPWIRAEPIGQALPQQGWKLHVSSYASTAADTLRRVLPVIVAKKAAFKLIGSIAWLSQINRGSAGLSQVGKFMTIYPRDDAEAVEVGLAVADSSRSLRGPEVPSDWAIEADSVVHYRYGAFGDAQMQTRLGEILPSLTTPSGELEPDRRASIPRRPAWVEDPFAARGLGVAPRLRGGAKDRYQPVLTLGQAPGVLVQLALDVTSPRVCVLKRVRLRDGSAVSADDPAVRLRHEGALLAEMADLGITPQLHDVVDDGQELTLVIEDLGAQTLDQYVGVLSARGCRVPQKEILEKGLELTDALAALHDRGHLHGDVKSANVVVRPDGRLALIDLDLAHPIGTDSRPPGAGTRGYTSLSCRTGARATPEDDVHAAGAVLYLLATGAEPSRAPDPGNLLSRHPSVLNPAASPSLVNVIRRCLSDDPAEKYASAREVNAALVAMRGDRNDGDGADDERALAGILTAEGCLRLAREAANGICGHAEPSDDGLSWRSTQYVGKGIIGRDVNTGMAGTILVLAELADEFRDPVHLDVLRQGARALAHLPPFAGAKPAGLYVGEAGVATALLRAGQVLADPRIVDMAVRRACADAHRPIDSPDMFHGAAGRLLTYLLMWDETQDPETLGYAVGMGEALLKLAEGQAGEAHWPIPAGYADLSGQHYLGYAHGAAGIADALLDLYEATEERRFADTATDAVSWIVRNAVPVLDDGSGLGWPQVEGGRPHPPFWCHGATGIGRLLLHAAKLNLLDASDLLARTARSVAHGARWSGPTLCHGLAGNADFLLDMAYATGESRYRDDADRLLLLANAFLVESDEGCAWISEAPRQISPDYLIGYGGIALTHLRRGTTDRPHQLSRAGFRYRSDRDVTPTEPTFPSHT